MTFDPSRVSQVACPQCGAPPGERCRTRTGKRYTGGDFHVRRKGLVYPSFLTDIDGRPKRGVAKDAQDGSQQHQQG